MHARLGEGRRLSRKSANLIPVPTRSYERRLIECQGHGFLIGCATMQDVEIRNAFVRKADNLGINNQRFTEPGRFLDNARIALGPIGPIHCKKTYSALAYVNLQPVAVVLQLVQPARSRWGLSGYSRLTGMNKSSRRI